jgi:RNA polymerase sigma-70 factor (ECF subfamily)
VTVSSDPEVLILDSASDSELLAAHVAGHPDAFTEIVRRHRDRLWAVALKTTGDPEDAADALQDALISAYRRASQFRGDSQVTTWLHRIVVNASLDRLRRRSTRPTVPLPVEEETGIPLPDPEDRIGRRELQLDIAAALAELPEDQREAVALVDIEGWSVDQAALMLGCPAGTVKSRCSRGRAKLAKRLSYMRNPDPESPVIPLPGQTSHSAQSDQHEAEPLETDRHPKGGNDTDG